MQVLLLERDELRLLAGLLLHGQEAGGGQQIAAGAGAEAQQGGGGDGPLTLLPQPLSGWWVADQMLGFNLSLFSLYSLVPWLLQKRGAVFLNLRLLSADLWVMLIGTLLLGEGEMVSTTPHLAGFADPSS